MRGVMGLNLAVVVALSLLAGLPSAGRAETDTCSVALSCPYGPTVYTNGSLFAYRQFASTNYYTITNPPVQLTIAVTGYSQLSLSGTVLDTEDLPSPWSINNWPDPVYYQNSCSWFGDVGLGSYTLLGEATFQTANSGDTEYASQSFTVQYHSGS